MKIDYLQRKVIISSILYYEMSASPMLDSQFDEMAKQLVQLQRENPELLKSSQYGYCFNDFDGSTGFYLYDALTEKDREYLTHLATLFGRHFISGETIIVSEPVIKEVPKKKGMLF